MADVGIKNVVVKKESLGKVSSENGRVIRFRIVAEDKNRKSAWSQIFMVNGELVQVLPGDISIVGSTILVNWSNGANPSEQTKYDIFAQYDSASPILVGTTTGNSFSFLKTGTPATVKVLVQLAAIKPVVSTSVKIFDSGVRSATTGLRLV